MLSARAVTWYLKPAVFVLCLLPLVLLVLDGFAGRLGANPIEVITHTTGLWTLRFLLITLAVTPARRLTGFGWLIRLRRMLGLFAFFYAALHLFTFLWLDQFFLWGEILRDIYKRPFITAGMGALLLMLPLALTSTNGMMRRLGSRWKRLHRLVYAVVLLGVLHFFWLVKADLQRPLFYAALAGLLLGYRLWVWGAARGRTPSAATSAGAEAAPRANPDIRE